MPELPFAFPGTFGATAPSDLHGPDYNPQTWATGYQTRQFGVSGHSVLGALDDPPAEMETAAAGEEPIPPYDM